MIDLLRKIIPAPIKQAIARPLRKALFPGLLSQPDSLKVAGKPGSPNLWWHELEKSADRKLFPPISQTARQACSEIRDEYRPVLSYYDIDAEQFFWGSIKDEEAETLYQLVLERKPKVAYQVGTFVGYSALVIAHALRANGGGLLIAVDPEIPHRTFINSVDVARRAAREQKLDGHIRFERGWHSIPLGDYLGRGLKLSIPTVGLNILKNLENGVDFAFIDGDHSTSNTMADFLLLKDFLTMGGEAVFHDAYSWPTVAQAIYIMLHDIHYYVRGTSAYFGFDVQLGKDGLVVLERIAYEMFPTMRITVLDPCGSALSGADIYIPSLDFKAKTGSEGAIYILAEVTGDAVVEISHSSYASYRTTIEKGTNGDFAESVIQLPK